MLPFVIFACIVANQQTLRNVIVTELKTALDSDPLSTTSSEERKLDDSTTESTLHNDVTFKATQDDITTRHDYKRKTSTSKSSIKYENKTSSPVGNTHSESLLRLIYIKTRKTGSSTMTNILYRFALRHNLTVMTFSNMYPIHKLKFLKNYPKPEFKLIMEHLYYDERFFDELMPGRKIFISSLRHPFSQLNSDIHYQKNRRSKLPKAKIKLSALRDKDILKRILMSPKKLKQYGQRYLKMPDPYSHNDTDENQGPDQENHFRKHLQNLSTKFLLILITEYYDASLVLLKRRMSWELQDIIYSPLKMGQYEKKDDDHSNEFLSRHQQLRPKEYALFEHFNQTLWADISGESQDFWGEVWHYKNINDKILKFCDTYYKILEIDTSKVETIIHQNRSLRIEKSPWNNVFEIDSLDCVLMKTQKDVFRIMNTIKNFPQLCDNQLLQRNTFARKWFGTRTFFVKRSYPMFDRRYCSSLSTRYKIPIEVMAAKESYDWDDFFKKPNKFRSSLKF